MGARFFLDLDLATLGRRPVQRVDHGLDSAAVGPGRVRLGARLDAVAEPLVLPLPRGAEVVARSPSRVEIRLDSVIRKHVRVRADLVGEVPEGYRLEGVDVVPRQIMLEGARGILRRMREVPTRSIDLSELKETTQQQVPLVLDSGRVWRADERGEPVEVEVRITAPDVGAGSGPGTDQDSG